MPDLTEEAFALSDALVDVYAEMRAITDSPGLLDVDNAELLADLLEQARDIGRRQDENDAARWMGEAA